MRRLLLAGRRLSQRHRHAPTTTFHGPLRLTQLSSMAALSSSAAFTPTPQNDLPSVPIDFEVASKIEGEESQAVLVELRPGERLRAESGSMLFMTDGIVMDTKLAGASSAFSRFLTGQNLFLTDFTYEGAAGSGTVGLGTDFPSKILRLRLDEHPGRTLICQRGAYLASNPDVAIESEFSKSLTAGFFGGQGFILQRLSGEGDVLLKGGGAIVSRDLAPGEVLRVTSGSIVAFENTVQYDVQMMPGIQNAMFGGEGLFVTTLMGPGRLWLQGMPPDRMIAEIARRVPGPGVGLGVPIMMGGGGGGEDGAVADGGSEADMGTADGSDESVAAASESAIDADRQAAVASSDLDADSPSALFGDAAGDQSHTTTFENNNDVGGSTNDDFSFQNDDDFGFEDNTSFSSGGTEETTFSDGGFEDSFSGDDFEDGELFDDTAGDDFLDEESAGSAIETAFETLRSIFDFFNDDR